MAKVTKVTTKTVFLLKLDEDEAGYLRALLYCHVAGSAINPDKPLGRISEALKDAEVPYRVLRNTNQWNAGSGYEMPHPCLEEDAQDN